MPASRPSVLEVRHVTKRFGQFSALTDVSMAVEAGTVHGLCGENGAGKSTLIKILDGQYPANSFDGELLVDGKPVSLSSPEDAGRNGIAVVPQETNVVDTLTVAENIVLGRWPGGHLVRQGSIRATVADFLEKIGIELDPAAAAGELSASRKQLLMIARALFTRPRVLLLDEPTTALTHAEVENLYRLVTDLRSHGVTVLLISHKLEEITHLCDRVSVLRDSELVDNISRKDLSRERLVRVMTGKELRHLYPEKNRRFGEAALVVSGVAVADPRVPGRMAVKGVDLNVRAGEVVGIGGPLGAGRSELLLALIGALPRSGSVTVNGAAIPAGSPGAAMRAGLAFVPEERKTEGLLFNLDISENTTLSAIDRVLAHGFISPSRESGASESAIDQLNIAGGTPRGMIGTLSGGNQQKVLLSRALFTEPKVVLLDEPTKGVDIAAKAEIYTLINSLAERGLAVVMVSSELPELLGNCDRIYMMNRGLLVREFDARHTSREQLLEAAMSGEVGADV